MMTPEEFEERFDNGEDMTAHLDFSRAIRPGKETQKIQIEFSASMIHSLDEEALRLGVARQAMVQTWIRERLQLHSA